MSTLLFLFPRTILFTVISHIFLAGPAAAILEVVTQQYKSHLMWPASDRATSSLTLQWGKKVEHLLWHSDIQSWQFSMTAALICLAAHPSQVTPGRRQHWECPSPNPISAMRRKREHKQSWLACFSHMELIPGILLVLSEPEVPSVADEEERTPQQQVPLFAFPADIKLLQ